MPNITFKGNAVHTLGDLPKIGSQAPDFSLTKNDLSPVTLKEFSGKNVILNIFPSIDTPVCQASTRKFNEAVSKLDNTVVLCLSKDLPFALGRFCGAEGLKNVITGSEYKNSDFGNNYKVTITNGILEGLFSRAIVIVGSDGKVIYTEQVPDIAQEPNYEKALSAVKDTAKV